MMSEEEDVLTLLPHRPPMLMVDRVLALQEDGCIALKTISHNEPCFQGHFPGNPIFPGVLIIEALAQTCALWMNHNGSDRLPIFAGITSAAFLRKVRPGDVLELSIRFLSEEKGFYTFQTEATVDRHCTCKANLTICYKGI